MLVSSCCCPRGPSELLSHERRQLGPAPQLSVSHLPGTAQTLGVPLTLQVLLIYTPPQLWGQVTAAGAGSNYSVLQGGGTVITF